MLESPLMDCEITYSVHDAAPAGTGDGARGWIDFTRPTRIYRNGRGERQVDVRLTVEDGRLSVTAPCVYARGSIKRTTDPPPDRDGTLRVVRLGDEDQKQLDLTMASDGIVTAVLRMETIRRPFNRHDIVKFVELFVEGIDLLDIVIRRLELLMHDS